MFLSRLLASFTLAILLLPSVALGGKKPLQEGDEKFEYHFTDTALDGAELKIEVSKAHTQRDFALATARFENKSGDYLLLHKEQILFRFDFGDRAVKGGKAGKPVVIAPGGKKKLSLKVTGSGEFESVRAFSLQFDALQRVASKGEAVKVPEFQLPASVNSFEAGPFSCSLKGKVTQETDLTKAKFLCTYNGEQVGFIDPTRVALRIPSGQEFANTNNKAKRKLLQSGDKMPVVVSYVVERKVVDMQFAILQLDWRDAFSESPAVPMAVGGVELSYDADKTIDHNN
ncbi:MAG: hypothetical protein CL928_03525 [Deltaproteobacteria bacterium]|nr:hypothetical protein [Deltaproteobacteria bacterium]